MREAGVHMQPRQAGPPSAGSYRSLHHGRLPLGIAVRCIPELWDDKVRQGAPMPSAFNRLVVMETTDRSWDSVSRVEVDQLRFCISSYLLSAQSPTGAPYRHTTFTGRLEGPWKRIILWRVDRVMLNIDRYFPSLANGRRTGSSHPGMVVAEPPSPLSTMQQSYTDQLVRKGSAWWKRLLDVQRPYRSKLRRLGVGFMLDIGCGLGRNLEHVDGHGVGIDYSPASVELCRSKRAYTPESFVRSEWAPKEAFDSIPLSHVAST